MTWSYKNPDNNSTDLIRFLIGDTIESDPLLQDEEVNYFLNTVKLSINASACECVLAIIAKISREYDQSVGPVKYTLSQRVKHFKELLKKLEVKRSTGVSPYCGGISISDTESIKSDTDRIEPRFTRDLDEKDEGHGC